MGLPARPERKRLPWQAAACGTRRVAAWAHAGPFRVGSSPGWLALRRTVAVVSPQGELLREVKLKGQKPTNVAFGGPEGRTVFVTLQDRGAIEAFRVAIPGRETGL